MCVIVCMHVPVSVFTSLKCIIPKKSYLVRSLVTRDQNVPIPGNWSLRDEPIIVGHGPLVDQKENASFIFFDAKTMRRLQYSIKLYEFSAKKSGNCSILSYSDG